MARCSNSLLNAGVLVLTVVVLGGRIWLSNRAATTDCERFMERPVIALGVLLLAQQQHELPVSYATAGGVPSMAAGPPARHRLAALAPRRLGWLPALAALPPRRLASLCGEQRLKGQ